MYLSLKKNSKRTAGSQKGARNLESRDIMFTFTSGAKSNRFKTVARHGLKPRTSRFPCGHPTAELLGQRLSHQQPFTYVPKPYRLHSMHNIN